MSPAVDTTDCVGSELERSLSVASRGLRVLRTGEIPRLACNRLLAVVRGQLIALRSGLRVSESDGGKAREAVCPPSAPGLPRRPPPAELELPIVAVGPGGIGGPFMRYWPGAEQANQATRQRG